MPFITEENTTDTSGFPNFSVRTSSLIMGVYQLFNQRNIYNLLNKVKTQYVHLCVDIFIKRTILLQFTPMLKRCINTYLIQYTAYTCSYARELIVCSFLHELYKGKGSSLQLICNVHTTILLCGRGSIEQHVSFFILYMACNN